MCGWRLTLVYEIKFSNSFIIHKITKFLALVGLSSAVGNVAFGFKDHKASGLDSGSVPSPRKMLSKRNPKETPKYDHQSYQDPECVNAKTQKMYKD